MGNPWDNPEWHVRNVEAAIKERDVYLDGTDDLVRKYAGDAYRRDWSQGQKEPTHYEYVVNLLPQLVFANPRVKVKSTRPQADAAIADAMTHGLQRWVRDAKLAKTLTPIAQDMLFRWGVGVITLEPVPGKFSPRGYPAVRPRIQRVSPFRYFMDGAAECHDAARFEGHFWTATIEELLNARTIDGRPRYDAEAVRAAAGSRLRSGLLGRESSGDVESGPDSDFADQRGVTVWEVYVPATGMIYTLAGDKRPLARFIRKPRRFIGWKSPYRLFGVYGVMDHPYPLSPIAAFGMVADELNQHVEGASKQASQAKTITVVDSMNAELAKAVKEGRDGEVWKVAGFNGQMAQLALGGVNPATLQYIALMRDRADRTSGITDVQRGNIAGVATATEISVATQAGDARTRFMRGQFRENVLDLLEGVAFMLFSLPEVVFPVPIDRGDGQSSDGEFRGGTGSDFELDRERAAFSAIELNIEAYSMEPESEEREKQMAAQMLGTITSLAPTMPQMPFVAWRELVREWGRANGVEKAERFIDWPKLEQLTQQQLAGLAPPAQDVDVNEMIHAVRAGFGLDSKPRVNVNTSISGRPRQRAADVPPAPKQPKPMQAVSA